MNKKEKFFERLQNRTNINNTTNTTNTKNILITSKIVPSGSNQKEVDMTSSSSGQDFRGGVSPLVALPPTWFGVKLDLFENDHKLKLKVGVMLLKDKSHVNLIAQLNSPTRMMYRGTQEFPNQEHWRSVKSYEKYLKNQKIDYRCSKLVTPRKTGSINDMACFVWLDGVWCVTIIHKGTSYEYTLTGTPSEAFKKHNGIATGYFSGTSATNSKTGISSEDLGL